MKAVRFTFEELKVWHKALDFADKIIDVTESTDTNRKHYRLLDQLESAATSVALNIAEGKGRSSKKEFIQFLYVSRGSLFETITLLTIFHRRNWIDNSSMEKIEVLAEEISKMISSLINSVRHSLT